MATYSTETLLTYHEVDHPTPWDAAHKPQWEDYHAVIARSQSEQLLITRHFFRAFVSATGNYRLNVTLEDGRQMRWDFTLTWPGSTMSNTQYQVDTVSGTFNDFEFRVFQEMRRSMQELIIRCHITEWDRVFTYSNP